LMDVLGWLECSMLLSNAHSLVADTFDTPLPLHLPFAVRRRLPSSSHIPIHFLHPRPDSPPISLLACPAHLVYASTGIYTSPRQNSPAIPESAWLDCAALRIHSTPALLFATPSHQQRTALALYHSCLALRHILPHARPPALVYLIALTDLGTSTAFPRLQARPSRDPLPLQLHHTRLNPANTRHDVAPCDAFGDYLLRSFRATALEHNIDTHHQADPLGQLSGL
jgi:hypothetical protein